MQDYTVRDSSIWANNTSKQLQYTRDMSVKLGVVRNNFLIERKGGETETRYTVEVHGESGSFPVICIRGSRFGGIYNYEEYTQRGFTPGESPASKGIPDILSGDLVVVAFFYGDSREGVILTNINHRGRKEKIIQPDGDFGVEYICEFNGIETQINADGEYIQTFRGQPTNLDLLKEPTAGAKLPEAEYDKEIGTSFSKWDKTGSWTLSDNATEKPQTFFMDKPNGKIVITSGDTILTIDKNEEKYTVVNKHTEINSEETFTLNTKTTTVDSSELIDIKTTKTLIDSSSLIDAKAENIKTKGIFKQTGNFNATDLSKGSINIEDGKVALGNKAMGIELLQLFELLLTALASDLGNLGYPQLSVPVAEQLKQKLLQIKGTL